LSFIAGVFIVSLLKIPLVFMGGFFISGIILICLGWIKNGKVVVAGFCLIVFALAGGRFWQKERAGNLALLNGQGRLVLTGRVIDLPDVSATSQRLKIEAESALVLGRRVKVSGLALATTNIYPQYEYGDRLEIAGQLKEPENFHSPTGEFDYKNYLAKSDIYSVIAYPEIKILTQGQGSRLKQSLFWLKQKFEAAIEKILPEPQAAFLAGLTLGENKELSQELSDAFKKTGTTHIIALSGYNISIIAAFFMTIFGWFMLRRSLRFWLAVLAIIFFTILTGASASVVRAAIMGILVLLARQEGRMYNVRNALAFAGAVMIFLNPKILRFDIGFQLSFGATMGLVWLAPVFEKWLEKLPRVLGLEEILIATLSAQFAVLPLLLVYFGQLSIISPAANLVILIFVPWAMLIGFIAGGAAMIWLAAGKILGWLAWLVLTFEIKAAEFFARLPLSAIKVQWGWPVVTIYYLILLLFLYRFYLKQRSEILVEKWADSQKSSL